MLEAFENIRDCLLIWVPGEVPIEQHSMGKPLTQDEKQDTLRRKKLQGNNALAWYASTEILIFNQGTKPTKVIQG